MSVRSFGSVALVVWPRTISIGSAVTRLIWTWYSIGQVYLFARRGFGLGLLLPWRLSATAVRMRSFKAASSTLSPSWMSMARLTFPSRLELNRPEGSFNAAPLANVIFTTFLYVSPVHTMPPWEKMGVPLHFHSSMISGSASCTISRTFASVFPRQSPSSLILSSINAEADSCRMGLLIYSSRFATYFSCAQEVADVACKRRQKKYESTQSTLVAAD